MLYPEPFNPRSILAKLNICRDRWRTISILMLWCHTSYTRLKLFGLFDDRTEPTGSTRQYLHVLSTGQLLMQTRISAQGHILRLVNGLLSIRIRGD